MRQFLRNPILDQMKVQTLLVAGATKYLQDFLVPFWTAALSFQAMEKRKLLSNTPWQNGEDYLQLLQFNLQTAEKGIEGTRKKINDLANSEFKRMTDAMFNTFFGIEGEGIDEYWSSFDDCLEGLVNDQPKEIKIAGEYFGFHFDNGGYQEFTKTERFVVYQVLPTEPGIEVKKDGKPILIIHPYVLGPNILAFLPGEGKSYVHAFANQGIPTYVRILKDINETPAVQTMTGENDACDTRCICCKLMKKHGKLVTLNGFCQGGFMAVLDILSGKLDGLVDTLITCVAPMDGTRSLALKEYMEHLPERFRDLNYAEKELPNGNKVVDGKVMSWVYKLKSMEKEFSTTQFFSDVINARQNGSKVNKTAAAMKHWLIYDRSDLPIGITELSFDSYTIPIFPDGTLPIVLFGKKLNFKSLRKKKIKWLLCYAEEDDLVDAPVALAPLDFLGDETVEVTVFPKGHGAIATSWSNRDSKCALHKMFEHKGKTYRGPVHFQLDLDAEASDSVKKEEQQVERLVV